MNAASRFSVVPKYTIQRADGVFINVYLQRTLLQSQDYTTVLADPTTRLDLIALDAYSDASKWWAISDCADEIDPFMILEKSQASVPLVVPSLIEVNEFTAH